MRAGLPGREDGCARLVVASLRCDASANNAGRYCSGASPWELLPFGEKLWARGPPDWVVRLHWMAKTTWWLGQRCVVESVEIIVRNDEE